MPRPPLVRRDVLTIQLWVPLSSVGPIRPDGPEQLWFRRGAIATGVHWMLDHLNGRQITVNRRGAFLWENGQQRKPLYA